MVINNDVLPTSGTGAGVANVVPVTMTIASTKRPIDHFDLFIRCSSGFVSLV